MLRISVEKAFRDFTLAASFHGPAPGITVLFGPSGAGKSSILNALCGLMRPDFLECDLNGEKLHRLPPRRRRIGTVFQDSLLFPHMSVRNNLLFGWRRARRGPVGFEETVMLLGLEPLLRRRPATLSGGERQRVAIGRALLMQPRLLLMDEPLASLDQARRDEILPYLKRLRDTVQLPIIYVTHAAEEMERLADEVVLLKKGRVQAAGPLGELASRVDLPLAGRRDAAGILAGYLHSHDPERRLSVIAAGGQLILVAQQPIDARTPVRLRIPARDVFLVLTPPRDSSVNNVLQGVVGGIGFEEETHTALVEVDIGGGQVLARVTMDAAERLRLRTGARVYACIESLAIEVI